LNSKHSGVPEDSKSSTFPSVGLHPHTWPKWGCDIGGAIITHKLLLIVVEMEECFYQHELRLLREKDDG
jgi:hypothetical protein